MSIKERTQAGLEAGMELRITEEMTLPEYLINKMLDLQAEVTTLRPQLEAMELRVETALEREAEFEAEVGKLESEVAHRGEMIDDLEERLEKAETQHKRWLTRATNAEAELKKQAAPTSSTTTEAKLPDGVQITYTGDEDEKSEEVE